MIQPSNRESQLDQNIGPIKRFGRYTLIKKLATGGMAEIWLARQSGVAGFNRFVVIKKILSHLAEEETFRNMFLDEARMSAQLQHPNIVQVYDLGEADQTYFIAMEFIMGENLAAIAWRGVKRSSPLSPTFAARIMADACKALDYAHRLRGPDGKALEIVHRDISPQNILVTYEGEVKVVDFGIAKAASKSQHTKTGMLKGKFSYMSPEQCLGNPVDKRSDVFALGIVLYELCTGKRLFKHESELMILEMITKRRITPPSEVADNIPADLEAIIMKALEKDVETRYQSAQDLQIALEDFIRKESEPSSNSDVAAYMRSLFTDKIEEKRRLCELASRDDFGQASFDEEPTERASQRHLAQLSNGGARRPVVSQPPRTGAGQIHVNGVVRPGMGMTGPGMQTGSMQQMHPHFTPQGLPGAAMNGRMTANGYHPQLSGMVSGLPFPSSSVGLPAPAITEERGGWLPRIIMLVAILVIVIAATFIINEYMNANKAQQTVAQQPNRPPANAQHGQVEVDSQPTGAIISVDGKVVMLEDNTTPARTPISQLTNLVYGQTYTIKLEKEGYETYTEAVLMGPDMDKHMIRAVLKAIPGRIVVEVSGSDNRDVTVYFDDKRAGLGPIVESRLPPGTVRVTAELNNQDCRATPEDVVVPPGGTGRATVHCSPRRGGGRSAPIVRNDPPPSGGGGGIAARPDPGPRTDPGGRPTPPPPHATPKGGGAGGCALLEGVPPGYVTIDTVPYSEIYYEDKKLGDTPLSRQKLPAGCVELIAKSKDPVKQKKVRIQVEPNSTRRFRFEL
ncbi:MAG: serine/threonine-protein kinase [Myxococcota bacterium]